MKCLLKCIGNIYAEADMKKTFDVKRLTTLALLTTIALTIFVVESAIPTLAQNRS
jgi:heptaprenyl diphosphate synthase